MLVGRSLQELAIEIERQKIAKADYLADTRKIDMAVVPDLSNEAWKPVIRMGTNGDTLTLDINEIAHGQIASHTGIPYKYYNRMQNTDPELLARNVNTWFQKEPQTRMVRTLDGTARAFLSEKYRRIDHAEIAEAVLPMIGDMPGATVESCQLTDKKMYIKVLNPRIQTEIVPGDVVQSGLLISNSEVGLGSVAVLPLVYRLVCSNGMIAADNGQRKFHVGRVNEADDNYEIFRSVTIEAEDKAFVLKLQDIVRATADSIQFERIVNVMRTAADARMSSPDIPKVVQLASRAFGITENEGKGVLDHLIRGSDLSLYGLANAVTRTAQDVQNYDRSTELEMTGWDIMNMPRSEWTRINNAD